MLSTDFHRWKIPVIAQSFFRAEETLAKCVEIQVRYKFYVSRFPKVDNVDKIVDNMLLELLTSPLWHIIRQHPIL